MPITYTHTFLVPLPPPPPPTLSIYIHIGFVILNQNHSMEERLKIHYINSFKHSIIIPNTMRYSLVNY